MSRAMPLLVHRAVIRFAVATVVILSLCTPSISSAQVEVDPDTLVYHQITNLGEDNLTGVGFPVLSADGTTAVFSDAPGTGDDINPNRIFTVNADGTGLTEVDAYKTSCYCGALVDISSDGSVVVSSESVQIRVATGGSARELLFLNSGELGPLRLTADGATVYFLIRRDVGTLDGQNRLTKGVWAIDTDGENLRQIVSYADVGEVAGIPDVDVANACCFYGDGVPLDVSDDAGRVSFGSYGIDGEYVYAADGDGGDLHQVAGPFSNVKNVALSGDGSMIAYDVVLVDGTQETGVVDYAGGDTHVMATATYSSFDDRLYLTPDGSQLLVSPASLLIDTATGDRRQLAALTPGAPGHTAVLADGMARASMNDDATRFLYVMSHIRCADCTNQHEQLAVLHIGPDETGLAPQLLETALEPNELTIGTDDRVTATAEVAYDGELVAVGVIALRNGISDINVARSAVLVDDGTLGDTRSNDDVFTNNALAYLAVVAREDDTGPRTMRFQAEIIGPDGLHHAIAVDGATLTVMAP